MGRIVVCLLCLVVCASSCGVWEAPTPAGAKSAGVYSEFLAYDEVANVLPALAEWGLSLNLGVPAETIGDAALASLLRSAEAAGVEVRIWLLLDIADGYWPNEQNIELFAGQVTRLLDWLEAEGLTAAAVVYDMEPSFAYSQELRDAWDWGIDAVAAIMRGHMDPAAFEAARTRLAESVREVQSRGFKAVCATYPQVVDDMRDGDDDLQDALDIPVRGAGFDEVALMVYQTAFGEAVGEWLGPSLVRSFAADARRQFGDRAAIALGHVGAVGLFEPTGPVYECPADLAADVAAARAEGIGRVEIYSLDGVLLLGGLEDWLAASAAAPQRAESSAQVCLVRFVTAWLDNALDAPPCRR